MAFDELNKQQNFACFVSNIFWRNVFFTKIKAL